jgi:dienelactone hydrolase
MKRFLALLLSALAALGGTARAQSYVIEDLRIPVPGAGAAGLEAVLVKPAGGGRNPLALITNGSPRLATDRPGMRAMNQYPQALEFARRGFTAVAVLRRGYGGSGGGWAESNGPCGNPIYTYAGRVGAEDLRASILALEQRNDVDPSRVVAVGVSAGGFATVALTEDPPPGLRAAISFAGGRGSTASDTVCAPDRLAAAFGEYGKRSRLPMLWVYAANDHFFGPVLADQFRAAFAEAGGHARFVRPGPFGTEGHFLFSKAGIPIWTPLVDDFLREQRLLPISTVLPPPDAPPPPNLSANGIEQFRAYLAATPHKAFAATPAGAFGWVSRRRDVREADTDALKTCTAHGEGCRVVIEDNGLPPR